MKNRIGTSAAVFTVAVMSLLSACDLPTAVWSKKGVTEEKYSEDNASCEEAVKETNFGVGPTSGPNKKAYYERCMTDLGYTREGEKSGGHLHNASGVLETGHE